MNSVKTVLDCTVDLDHHHALRRLRRFVRVEREYSPKLNDAGLGLVRHAVFAAYMDCKRLGFVDDAQQIIDNEGGNDGDAVPSAPCPAT